MQIQYWQQLFNCVQIQVLEYYLISQDLKQSTKREIYVEHSFTSPIDPFFIIYRQCKHNLIKPFWGDLLIKSFLDLS